jgi:hypothetical protein
MSPVVNSVLALRLPHWATQDCTRENAALRVPSLLLRVVDWVPFWSLRAQRGDWGFY